MKYLKSLSFRTKAIVSLILLALVTYSAYSYVWPKYVQWKEDHEVQIVKTKVERIETFGSQNRYVYYKTKNSIPADVLSNHFVTSDAKFVGIGNSRLVELSVNVYDLNHINNPPKRIDVVKLIQKYNQDYKLDFYSTRDYTVNGIDYLVFSITNKENKDDKKEIALDVDTEQIGVALPEDKLKEQAKSSNKVFAFLYTNLDDILEKNGITGSFYLSYNKNKNGLKNDSFNFIKEFPEIFDKLEKGGRILVRKGEYNNPEAIFQDMRHWFAPVGQDKLDVIATDPKTNEQTPINTYQEYKEWYETHRDHL
ncbi:hypothetical protein [Streptococcus parasanguinis]|uniref:hypothetical protein n=1 Tax=Streptococcus parasanguinis TaxID=1318 RepID=UPI0005F35F02|nr:hypothetical protein [Streptococcus parasanguinis]KJU89040.1 hypothetical protein TZ97_00752 [Streptococcus parasanguinis]